MRRFKVLFLFGPTASGKSEIAIKIAKHLNGVVINADSMQVYKGVENIIAAPTKEQYNAVNHKLYGFVDPKEHFTVKRWHALAMAEIHLALKRGKLPILCGGTGLYATALLKGLAHIPEPTPAIRQQTRKQQQTLTHEEFYSILCKEDPIMAKRIQPRDTQRISRALEVVRTTNKSLMYFHSLPSNTVENHNPTGLITLVPDRTLLYKAIDRRFDAIIAKKGVEEIYALKEQNIPSNAQILKAIGVCELLAYIEGAMCLQQAIFKAKAATRRYAKRQYTYMKHQLTADFIVKDASHIPDLLCDLKNKI